MVRKLEALSAGFRTYHSAIVDQTGDQDKLTKEQAALDNHEDKAEDLVERLEDRVATIKLVMPDASSMDDY